MDYDELRTRWIRARPRPTLMAWPPQHPRLFLGEMLDGVNSGRRGVGQHRASSCSVCMRHVLTHMRFCPVCPCPSSRQVAAIRDSAVCFESSELKCGHLSIEALGHFQKLKNSCYVWFPLFSCENGGCMHVSPTRGSHIPQKAASKVPARGHGCVLWWCSGTWSSG